MRIMKIRTWKHFGKFCGDQAAHAAIVDGAVIWFAGTWLDVLIAGAVILTVREVEQGRRTVKEWRRTRTIWTELGDMPEATYPGWTDLLRDLHLPDRFADVIFGTGLAVGAFEAVRAFGWL